MSNCIDGVCRGYNEKQNVINAYKHFTNLFLNITAPNSLFKSVEDVFQSYIATWDASRVLKATEELHKKFNQIKNNQTHALWNHWRYLQMFYYFMYGNIILSLKK